MEIMIFSFITGGIVNAGINYITQGDYTEGWLLIIGGAGYFISVSYYNISEKIAEKTCYFDKKAKYQDVLKKNVRHRIWHILTPFLIGSCLIIFSIYYKTWNSQ